MESTGKNDFEEIQYIDLDTPEGQDKLQAINESGKATPIHIKFSGESKLATGVVIPKNHPNALDYLKDIKDYNFNPGDIERKIKLCRKMYENEGVIGTAIDIFVDVSVSPIRLENIKNVKARKLIEYFNDNVNKDNNNVETGIHGLNRQSAFEFYLCGNAFLNSKWKRNTFVKTLNGEYILPMNISNLDPAIIDIPEESVVFGNKIIRISLEKFMGKNNFMSSTERDRILSVLPTKIRNRIKKNQPYIELNPEEIYHIKRKGSTYGGWGVPMLTRCLTAVATKRKLQTLDISTIEGMINSTTVYKVGDPNRPETWKPEYLTNFARLLNNPNPSLVLVAPWYVDHFHVGPNGEVLDFSDRYKDVNTDILQALGIPISLLTGQGDKAGDVWASAIFLVERLEEYREKFKAYLEDLYEKILIANDIDYTVKPTVSYVKPVINKEDIRNVLLALYDRGLISRKTVIHGSSFDYGFERSQIEEEQKSNDDEIFKIPPQPNQGLQGANPQDPNDNTDSENPKKDNKPKDSKTEVNQKTKLPTKRLQGNMRDKIQSIIEPCFNEGTSEIIKQKLYSLANIFDFNEIKDTVGMNSNEYKLMLSNCLAKTNDDPDCFKESLFNNIDNFFLRKDL